MNTITLTRAEFDALPEYFPPITTGLSIGTRWKRRGLSKWYMGEIVDGGGFPEIVISEIVIEDEVARRGQESEASG